MREKMRQLLDCPLPREYWAGLDRERARSSFRPTLLIGTAILIFEAGMMITTLVHFGFDFALTGRSVYFLLYLSLFLITLFCMLLAIWAKKKLDTQPNFFIYLSNVYGLAICFWSSYLSAYAHRSTSDITVFLYTVLGVAIVISMRPWQAFSMFGANLIFFFICLSFYAPADLDVFGSIVNSLIGTLLGALISSILFRNKAAAYYNQTIIVQQNEKIQMINEQLRDLILFDNLTAAYNRRYFDEVLPDKLEDDRHTGLPLTVLMLDIDRFKQYNDIYGHPAGDICLRTVADIARSSTISEEGAFIRYGGEEFLLYLSGLDEDRAVEVAESIRRNIARARLEHTGSPSGYVTISIGVAHGGTGTKLTLGELVDNADNALYSAKNAGRNKVVLYRPDTSPATCTDT